MQIIPNVLLKKLYTRGSLRNTPTGIRFMIKNRLKKTELTFIESVRIDGVVYSSDKIELEYGKNKYVKANEISEQHPFDFPLTQSIVLRIQSDKLENKEHDLIIKFKARHFGSLIIHVKDFLSEQASAKSGIPRDDLDDYTEAIIKRRQKFAEQHSTEEFPVLFNYSFDTHKIRGNCENLIGAAQVPVGIVGPLLVNGEFAIGEFLIPLATTEGTLIASYNRGIKAINLSGGLSATVNEGAMQRAPVFEFDNARKARAFKTWILDHKDEIAEICEASSNYAKLKFIEVYLSNKFAFLRFNFSTGDAAGQNMVSRATFAGCKWIQDQYRNIRHFYLESNIATDKKPSLLNTLHTRGKNVTAEAVIKRDVMQHFLRTSPEDMVHHSHISNLGMMISGSNNNGAHSANALTALFIATGQDVANIAESCAARVYLEITEENDLYISVTLPSLIIATFGGGTGLSTQKECLKMMDCYGTGKVGKLAEIMAGVVLAGELSLASAISSLEWVSSHEKLGRNRE